MAIDRSRLMPFSEKDIPPLGGEISLYDEPEILDAARDAGVALRIMLDEAEADRAKVAAGLGVSEEYLARAEQGELVEITHDGHLIDIAPTLLIRVARLLGRKDIPVP
jgi:hypothetical protein